MGKKEIAPTACPNCGEEKLWRSDTNPNLSLKKGAAYAASRTIFGNMIIFI